MFVSVDVSENDAFLILLALILEPIAGLLFGPVTNLTEEATTVVGCFLGAETAEEAVHRHGIDCSLQNQGVHQAENEDCTSTRSVLQGGYRS